MANKNKKFSVKRSRAGLGLFTNVSFEKDDFVIEYTGKRLPNKIADEKNSLYLFKLNSRWTIDGSSRKNLSRYINHSCRPNCEALIEDGKRIVIHARKKISPGEELTYDYGKEYFNEYIKPKGCQCEKCRQN